uniref:Serine carboxypeptidase S28 family protein n=1 Tax=Panagrolaimus davidi TaxID=227884 RepID=A0A914PG36_9BILA
MAQEGPSSAFSVLSPLHLIWAQNVSAGIWSLEHRFYGKSQPFKEQNVENLRYLSSEQYLADVANFIRTQNRNLNLSNPKWVVFGGSYSGSLALWFRQLYPDIAIGAVGSSAPIQPILDFYGY